MLQFMPSISTTTAIMVLTLEMSVSVGSKWQHLVTFFTFFFFFGAGTLRVFLQPVGSRPD